MTRYLVFAVALSSASCVMPCKPRLTETQAIALAKRALDADAKKNVSSYYGPYTAMQEDCRWIVTGHTPPQSVAGDARVAVAADTGTTEVWPIMRTDPNKLERSLAKRR